MELIQCNPWIRFADILCFEQQRGPSKTFDCRLLYTLSGEATLDLENQTYRLSRGCLVLFQPGTRYCIRPDPSVTLAVYDFDFTQDYSARVEYLPLCPADFFDPALAHRTVCFSDAAELNSPLFLEKASLLEASIHQIIAEFQSKQALFQGKASSLFKSLLYDIVRACQVGEDPKGVMKRVVYYIDNHLDQHITNRELGQALNYNPNYLNRLILRNTGMSLHRYVLQRRLSIATKLLASTQQPISDIAAGLGFHSPSHFSNFFKQETGLTPAQFRKTHIL